MIVVSDTSAVSNLLQIGKEGLLPELFERVMIPRAVQKELVAAHPVLPKWLEIHPVADMERVAEIRVRVHTGEAEALILALELKADWVLVDDGDGRMLAKELGLPVLGLVGVLLLAKQRGKLAEIKPWIDRLRDEANFFLSPAVREQVLRMAGEKDVPD